MCNALRIEEIGGDKKQYLPLLIIGDESERMIDRYIADSDLFIGFIDEKPIAACAAMDIDDSTVEIKNLAVDPMYRRQGIGGRMLEHVEAVNRQKMIILGTGETPSTLRFYAGCGYTYSHRIPDFFTDNYPDEIVEEGITLHDMVYLKKNAAD